MLVQRLFVRTLPAAFALLAIAAAGASAQEQRPLFTWTGRVDREAEITMRDQNVWTRYNGDNETGRNRSRVFAALPNAPGEVVLHVDDGRGDVDVVQQPDRRNDFTAVVRIRDPRSGSDTYRISAYWQPTRSGWDQRHGGAIDDDDRGDRRDRDDRGDRGDRGRGRDHDDQGGRNGGWDRGGYSAGSMHWRGDVDDEIEIRIQGRRVDYRNLRGAGMRAVRFGFTGQPLPARDAQVYVVKNDGRGSVTVVAQPSAGNGYTAVLRVKDSQGGFGTYDFDLNWR